MDQDIYALVGKYGFKSLHNRLTEIMKSEYEYLKSQFPVSPVNTVPRSIRPVETVPRPVIEKISSIAIKKGLSISRSGVGI